MSLDKSRRSQAGFTVPEVLVAATLVAIFFASILEVNAICLRYISASKENIGGIEAVHDRLERLRNSDFTTLTSTTSMKSVLATVANSSPLAQRAVETVTVSAYPAGAPTITYTRNSAGQVTSVPGSVSFASATLLQVDVSNQWQATFGNRAGGAQASTVVAAGIKK